MRCDLHGGPDDPAIRERGAGAARNRGQIITSQEKPESIALVWVISHIALPLNLSWLPRPCLARVPPLLGSPGWQGEMFNVPALQDIVGSCPQAGRISGRVATPSAVEVQDVRPSRLIAGPLSGVFFDRLTVSLFTPPLFFA